MAAFSFDKINWEKWLMVNFKKNKLPAIHIVDRYMETVKVFDVQNDGKGLDYFLGAEDEVDLSQYKLEKENYTAFVIGATHATKRLPNNKISEIVNKLEGKVILLGGKTDLENAQEIIKTVDNEKLINLCGQLSLNQSAFMVQQAKVVITHDTGLMHIAAAFHKKIISVWGNTLPEFGMTPYLAHPSSKIVEVKSLSCRPCTKIGFSSCPKKHFKCMNDISNEEIMAGFIKISETNV
jgi:heptosyltransferase-2